MTAALIIVAAVMLPVGVWVVYRIGDEAIKEMVVRALSGPRLPHEFDQDDDAI